MRATPDMVQYYGGTYARTGGAGLYPLRFEQGNRDTELPGDPVALRRNTGINARGDRPCVTNRGHDSIATFALDDSGYLLLLGHARSGGASPRFLLLLDAQQQMLVANEEGNSVAIFDIAADGTLIRSGEVAAPGPAYLFTTTAGDVATDLPA